MARNTTGAYRAPRPAPKAWVVTVVWLIGLAAVWTAIALLFDLNGASATKFPYLHKLFIWAFDKNYDGTGIWNAVSITFGIFAKGFVIGLALGIALAILMSLFVPVEKVSYPLLLLSQMIPMLGLAPIIVSMVGDFSNAKIVMSAYMTFFPIAANMFAGLNSVDRECKELLMMSAAGKFTVYQKLMLPASLSSLFIGIKIAAPSSLAAVIFTEVLYPQNGGIGAEMLNSQYGNDWELCWGYILVSVIVSVALFYSVAFLEKAIIRWKSSD